METLYLALGGLIKLITENWLVFLLVVIAISRKSVFLYSMTVSLLLSVLILGKVNIWFMIIMTILVNGISYYEPSLSNTDNSQDS